MIAHESIQCLVKTRRICCSQYLLTNHAEYYASIYTMILILCLQSETNVTRFDETPLTTLVSEQISTLCHLLKTKIP